MGKPLRARQRTESELLDIGEAAALLHVSQASLRRWTNSGHLPCLRVGQRRERRFRRGDLLSFLEVEQPVDSAPGSRPRLNSSLDTRASFTITRGDHLCGFYASDIGRISLAIPFLLDGLNEGSVCFLIGPLRARAEIIKHLKKKRHSLHADMEAGTLIPSGHHDSPRAQYGYFRKIMEKRASADAHSFRVFGDMWGLRSKISQASLIEFEALYDRLIARRYPVVSLCTYDVRRFSGVEVLEAHKGHRDTFRHPLEEALA